MASLKELPNIGPVLEEKLREVGIDTPKALRETGSREAFVRIRLKDPTACLHMLSALEGAVRGIPKKELPQDVRQELKTFFNSL
ncbi:TfoX/Sxy family protein [Zongyangia hominis]|uniref:TfoX/Sxy family protein n=1 Tax=Zongyangia hominis TaxID=2763677 RepID=A0A926EE20_9FIRM|nr:TfoX/Sxy family protein [Zongyangia hominis]MBC8570396.1 TfoX/Sxy family protein [Zongyangia hominis]